MRTVSTLLATGSLTAFSAVGLAVVRRDLHADHHDEKQKSMSTVVDVYHHHHHHHHHHEQPAVTTAAALDSPFSLPRIRPRRLASEGDYNGRKSASNQKEEASKRHSSLLTPARVVEDVRGEHQSASSSTSAPHSSRKWLRRLSNMSGSRDIEVQTPAASRPVSAAYTNGSIAVSHADSLTPISQAPTPPSLPPNKLVKRASSLRAGTPSPSSNSRLPIATFRRPATSHQRAAAAFHERYPSSDRRGRMSLDGNTEQARDGQWRHYFTPRVASEGVLSSKRRNSTGIPNPIRRVYPDRRYTPTLVSAKVLVGHVATTVDDGSSELEDGIEVAEATNVAPSSASSPFPVQPAHFEEATAPRRSFSIGDLLATGPQPLWRRPSSSRGKPWASRKARSRNTSESRSSMGTAFSSSGGRDAEPPAKRRDVFGDPRSSRRSVYSSASSTKDIELHLGSESPLVEFTPDHSVLAEPASRAETPSPLEGHRVPSNSSFTIARPVRVSATHSEVPSTVGSESEHRSLGEYSTDYQSDNGYDSFQTRTTRSSFGRRGPHIETIFDESQSPSVTSSARSTKLRDFLNDSQVSGGDYNARYRHSTIEEEESVISTPVRSLRNKSVASTPSARPNASQIFSSSPPVMNIMADPDEIDWDAPADEDGRIEYDLVYGLGIRQNTSKSANGTPNSRAPPFRFGPSLLPGNSRSTSSTPHRNGASPTDKTNLFDWSEQQPSPSNPNHSPPRPRTVHGKKDQDIRGSRAAGRRPVSGMHARSHSVPVVPDLDGKRHNVVANKFGTWGVGSKAVTEDWNEDFDFGEPGAGRAAGGEQYEERMDSGHEMFVPKSIREQQENVVANIGLLREWGLLIEELKELRIRAAALDMLHGQYAQAWREVDAMIELADQETEEETLEPRRSPPSSPGFDYSAFEDTPSSGRSGSGRRPQTPSKKNRDVSPAGGFTSTPPNSTFSPRPRKDSELVAQSVIAALQTKRNNTDYPVLHPMGSRKVPFDTATLRHIVPYVNGLTRKVKDAMRETEGLYSSPRRHGSPDGRGSRDGQDSERAFRNIFSSPEDDEESITVRRQRNRGPTTTTTSTTSTKNEAGASSLVHRLQRMTLPP